MKQSPLRLDPDELVACVSCGLCLPHCPTYRTTGFELASPRGRIAAMRAVESGAAPVDVDFVDAMESCVQCRGCETACPSGVPFGHLMEATRAALASDTSSRRSRRRGRIDRLRFGWFLTHPFALRLTGWLLVAARRARLIPRRYRIALPTVTIADLRARHATPVGGDPDVWLFTGCVMDAWMRPTHLAAARVVTATGARVARPERAVCCGALALHAGERATAMRLARQVMQSMPGDAPILVDAAGCGAALADYGHLLGTDAARDFARRIRDVSEWLADLPRPSLVATGRTVVVHDPCHLRHVRRVHGATRSVLAPAYELVEVDDDGLCCGAGGAYSAAQPELAAAIGARKAAALRAAGAGPGTVVASANPGCTIQLRGLGFEVAHPVELLAAALDPTSTEIDQGS